MKQWSVWDISWETLTLEEVWLHHPGLCIPFLATKNEAKPASKREPSLLPPIRLFIKPLTVEAMGGVHPQSQPMSNVLCKWSKQMIFFLTDLLVMCWFARHVLIWDWPNYQIQIDLSYVWFPYILYILQMQIHTFPHTSSGAPADLPYNLARRWCRDPQQQGMHTLELAGRLRNWKCLGHEDVDMFNTKSIHDEQISEEECAQSSCEICKVHYPLAGFGGAPHPWLLRWEVWWTIWSGEEGWALFCWRASLRFWWQEGGCEGQDGVKPLPAPLPDNLLVYRVLCHSAIPKCSKEFLSLCLTHFITVMVP